MVEGSAVSNFEVRPIGRIESTLRDREDAPRQGDRGAPDAWLVFDTSLRPGLADLRAGDDVLVLTWLHQAERDVLVVRPGGEPDAPLTGVFSTRSPDRPNPIGLHPVRVLDVEGDRVHVSGIEAIDGTPVLDVKPVLGPLEGRPS